MKPKFNIPLQLSNRELDQLIKMYAERISRHPDGTEWPGDWLNWNVRRLSELVALVEKK